MSTWVLIPNIPNPLTGFANPVLGWQLTLATALDALTGCNIVYAAGWSPALTIVETSAPNDPIWQLMLSKSTVHIVINDTDWFVFDGQNIWGIPESTVTANYTVVHQLVWAATTTAPIATAESGLEATIVFPQPSSSNGPFTYAVQKTDATANVVGEATLSGDPVVDGSGNVTLTVTGLTAGDAVSFVVTVNTQYSGVTANSIVSNSITATT